MEVQLAVKPVRRGGGHHVGDVNTINKAAAAVPNYLKPSTGSCHHACKYGGAHTFQDKAAPHQHQQQQQRKTRKQQRPPPPPVVSDHQKARTPPATPPLMSRARPVPRRLFGRGGRVKVQEEAAVVVVSNNKQQGKKKAPAAAGDGEGVEWKDIVAYDTVPLPVPSDHHLKDCGAKSQKESPDKDKPVVKLPVATVGTKLTTTTTAVTGNKAPHQESPTHHKGRNTNTDGTKASAKPPTRGSRKNTAASKKKAGLADHQAELVGGDAYQPLPPSLLQERANLLRDLEEEMTTTAREATLTPTTDVANEFKVEESAAAGAAGEVGSRRPVPAHRRVKSTSVVMSSSRSVRLQFTRQGSKNRSSAAPAFKLRSKSSKGPPSQEEEKPAASRRSSRSRRGSSMGGGADEVITGTGSTGAGGGRGGIQLRIRSLRRRGVGGGASAAFVVPAVSLRHQKTLEKKRSRRLYNSVIEETASRLVKTRKSRVKALVGAFESVINRIAK